MLGCNCVEDGSSALFEPPERQVPRQLRNADQQSMAYRMASNQGFDHEGSGVSRYWVIVQKSVSDRGTSI